MNTLKNYYTTTIISKLKKEFHYKNIHEIPKLKKIQINLGLGLNGQNQLFLKDTIHKIRLITGQQPFITKAKKSIAAFKIRKNMIIGLKVTLRREKMYAFLEKLIKLILPRLRDFRGLKKEAFDNQGNYNLGITDYSIFPELDFEKIQNKQGFNINIIINSKNKNESYILLKELGIPFFKNNN
jgi:large subunit ribosomal protein L5